MKRDRIKYSLVSSKLKSFEIKLSLLRKFRNCESSTIKLIFSGTPEVQQARPRPFNNVRRAERKREREGRGREKGREEGRKGEKPLLEEGCEGTFGNCGGYPSQEIAGCELREWEKFSEYYETRAFFRIELKELKTTFTC